jgi:pimeloyl-ACP methyl ester carboxylesterase
MKTPGVLFLALFAAATTSHASLRCGDLFSSSREAAIARAVEAHGPLRGVEKKPGDWTSDRAFAAMLSDTEKMGRVQSKFDQKLGTRIYYTSTGLPDAQGRPQMIDPESKAVVVFFHGSGTSQSGGANFVQNMNKLANLGYSAMSFDMPFHAEGPIKDKFNNADFFMNWVREVLAPARASGKPVYLVGHSFGPDVIAEYLYRFPFDVEGAALLSPASFNKTLQEWYRTHTSKMKFGGEVPQSTLGGQWAGTVSEGFTWARSEGVGDPTAVNHNLKVEILTGDREEYVPGPVGGPKKSPIGKNTYDMEKALRPLFRGAHIVVEPGIGHYLFDHTDRTGSNVVARTIFNLIGFDGTTEAQTVRDIAARSAERPYSVQLEVTLAYLCADETPIGVCFTNLKSVRSTI